jgi:hypothetical protein
VALVGADESTGAQEAKAGRRDIPRGDLVLAWVPSAHAAAHRAGRREGIGLAKASAVRKGERTEKPSVILHPSRAQAASGVPLGTFHSMTAERSMERSAPVKRAMIKMATNT